MVNVSRLDSNPGEVTKQLLRETKVATAPGSAFGQSINQYVRISLSASDEDIRTGVGRICQAITGRS